MAKAHTVPAIKDMKGGTEPIVALTAYDHPTSRMLDEAGVDVILVGDSLGMVVLGYPNTLSVTMDEMIHHTRAVSRAANRALVVGDMPFMSYQSSEDDAVKNAGRFLGEAGAQAVKLEGAGDSILGIIRRLVEVGVPVMGHLGLTPQSVNAFGGFKGQGKDPESAKRIQEEAVRLEEVGAFAIVLESIPAEVAKTITETIGIPTIGIGSGLHCDGQILVTEDILGLTEQPPPFAKAYAALRPDARSAAERYVSEVKSRTFPEA